MDIDQKLNFPRVDQRITSSRTSPSDPHITVIIDKESFAEFRVSRPRLISKSLYLSRLFATRPSSNGNTALPHDPVEGVILSSGTSGEKLFLSKLKVGNFQDFARWLNEGDILPFHFGFDQITIVASASRLVRALDIGIMLDGRGYQMTAMRKFHEVGAYLETPEDFVNEIFTATRQMPNHPARRMIVAITAAKTMREQEKAMGTSDGKSIERRERLKSSTFWVMYDEYHDVRKGQWGYPETFEKSILWGGYKQ
ncbi:hypothetical protein DOTSEDRAFT_23722 [Dothistroma septosporum NZE10]|uniref:Uncharacterized protein n=1 Tax=Dothistroma septosporum (strain NZE10 / CBS 128990) TaxID=675120 RepID=N1PS15_DOTSN|nr:hypothetical protein DOTSEDRAFT_23722 [Dothistroma septosporum NZE10]